VPSPARTGYRVPGDELNAQLVPRHPPHAATGRFAGAPSVSVAKLLQHPAAGPGVAATHLAPQETRMPANRPSDDQPTGPATDPAEAEAQAEAAEAQPMSRAERRAAARNGRTSHESAAPWSRGKVTGGKAPAVTRKQYSSRRSGG